MSDRKYLEEQIQIANNTLKDNKERIKRLKLYKAFSDKYPSGTIFKIIDGENIVIGIYGGGGHFYGMTSYKTDSIPIHTDRIRRWDALNTEAQPIISKDIELIPLFEYKGS